MADFYPFIRNLFFSLAFTVFYTYVGYGLVIWLLVRLRGKRTDVQPPTPLPDVTMVVPAYNERDYLPAKLQNCLDQDCPAERLHLLFVTEGSDDGSAEYLEQ